MKRVTRITALLLALCLLAAGCTRPTSGDVEENPFVGDILEKEEKVDINEVGLRDRKLLYANQDPTEVVTMYLTVMQGNDAEGTNHTWEEVNTYSAYDYEDWGVDRYKVAGLLQVGDENGVLAGELGYDQVSPNCTVQIRGQSSSRNPQKNYKIALKDNKGQWRGQSTIALNKHQSDGLRFRNKLGFDLLKGIDETMSLRTTFVHLYVKDTTAGDTVFRDYGIFTQVEQLNRTALAAHGLDKKGHLYKVNMCEFYRYEDVIKLTTDPEFDLAAFEYILETKGDDDHTKLIKMLEAVNDYTRPMEEVLDQYFDVENISYWMAFMLLTGNVDTQSRNFYIYSPLNGEKWYILPWDLDGFFQRTEHQIKGRVDYIEWESGISNYWGNVLFQRALKTETFRKALDAAVEDLRGYLTAERINGMVERYKAVVKPYLYSMPDQNYAPLKPNEYEQVAQNLYAEVEDNYNRYKESLLKQMPFYIGTPVKKANGYTVDWDPSYTFNGEGVTYSFELARDYTFANPIVKEEGLVIPTVTFDQLPAGQYFMRVRSQSESGYDQCAFDYYFLSTGKIYGTKCFYIDATGKVTEDVYAEN